MPNPSTHSLRFPIFKRLWKPAAATGAGGTAVALWFEEIIALGADMLALIFLPVMAGVLYLLDNLIFRSRLPRREDLENKNDPGAKK